MRMSLRISLFIVLGLAAVVSARAADNTPPPGFIALFNGRDLTGWKGLLKEPLDNPARCAKLTPEEAAEAQKEADKVMRKGWRAEKGMLIFNGRGRSICTAKDYGDFEMYVDWKIEPHGDSGVYLRGSPQVQIWDPNQWKIGSGGLYNNQKHPSKPIKIADQTHRPMEHLSTSRWSADKVTVKLNGKLVVDNVVLETTGNATSPSTPPARSSSKTTAAPCGSRTFIYTNFQGTRSHPFGRLHRSS